MATNVLDHVRAAVIANRPIDVQDGEVVFFSINTDTGEREETHRFSGDTKTAFHAKNTGKSYDLLSIVMCAKCATMSFGDYAAKCRADKANIVSTIDKKELLAYLNGDIDTSVQVHDVLTSTSAASKRKAPSSSNIESHAAEDHASESSGHHPKRRPKEEKNAPHDKNTMITTDTHVDEAMEAAKRILAKEYNPRDRTTMMTTPKVWLQYRYRILCDRTACFLA
jgi:hypothetical protein